jgi:Fructosamine-3-kinase
LAFSLPPHFTSIQDALSTLFGSRTKVAHSSRVAGGDINEAFALTLTDGSRIFMKSNTRTNEAFFVSEATGLHAIAQTNTIRTPRILCSGTDENIDGGSFLLLEYIDAKNRTSTYWETFARQLAAMHQASTADFTPLGKYGFIADNFIGAGKQINTQQQSWIAFFRDCRLQPQFETASDYFDAADFRKITKLLDNLDTFLTEPEYPSLLHGDLWSGNFITGTDGKAWLIDPAVYVGHAEADIAMTELFGGFSPSFYEAYCKAVPMQPGYHRRRDLYNLYHLLNHLNLFGQTYLSSVKRIIDEYV